jgi:hypothetical protein
MESLNEFIFSHGPFRKNDIGILREFLLPLRLPALQPAMKTIMGSGREFH